MALTFVKEYLQYFFHFYEPGLAEAVVFNQAFRNLYICAPKFLYFVKSMSKEVQKDEAKVGSIAETVKTSVALTKDLWQQIKIEAIKRGLTFAQVVETALRKWLEMEEQERERSGGQV